MNREGQLQQLLLSAFDADELKLWVRTDPALGAIHNNINWNQPAAGVAFDVVEKANARGLWDVPTFSTLRQERPNLDLEIQRIARLFHVWALIPDPGVAAGVEFFVNTTNSGFPRTPDNLRALADAAQVDLNGASFLPFEEIFRGANGRDHTSANMALLRELLRELSRITNTPLDHDGNALGKAWLSLIADDDVEKAVDVRAEVPVTRGPEGEVEVVEAVVVAEAGYLPFSYLQDGAAAGRSVARLQVPRIQGIHQSTGTSGTGWLITPGLLVTNHHVINARGPLDPDATEVDLRKQVGEMTVEFDVDAPDAVPVRETASELVCWSRRKGEGQLGRPDGLDFAIVRLTNPQDVALRPIRPLRHAEPLTGELAINIIQHPKGLAKTVALRANQLKEQAPDALRYTTNTDPGSSGSPLYDDLWRIVGLHRAAIAAEVLVHGTRRETLNVGTPLSRIVEALQTPGALDGGDGAAIWNEIATYHGLIDPAPAPGDAPLVAAGPTAMVVSDPDPT